MYRNVLKQAVAFAQPGWHHLNVNTTWSLIYRTAYHKTGYAPNSVPNFGNKVGFIHLKQPLEKCETGNDHALKTGSFKKHFA